MQRDTGFLRFRRFAMLREYVLIEFDRVVVFSVAFRAPASKQNLLR